MPEINHRKYSWIPHLREDRVNEYLKDPNRFLQMNAHGLYGQPFSKDEARNQWNEIWLLRQEFVAQNPCSKKGEAMDWAIESYFMGIRSSLGKPFVV